MEIFPHLPTDLQKLVWKFYQGQYVIDRLKAKHFKLFKHCLNLLPYVPFHKLQPEQSLVRDPWYTTMREYADSKYQECIIKWNEVDGVKGQPVVNRRVFRMEWKDHYHTLITYVFESNNFKSSYKDEYWMTKRYCLIEQSVTYIMGAGGLPKIRITETRKDGTVTAYTQTTVM
jgi:hypothetical protein